MKRIISLILVLATAFLMLTGCAFRYSKKDMSKYAEFDANAFKNALQALSITFGDFLADDTVRAPKVNDAVAQALLKVTDANKKFNGTLAKYDSVYFCYYATDANGNIFYGAKLDESKPTNIQLGLSTLDGLNAAIAEALLGPNIQNSIYSTSATNYVKYGDVVSVSYYASWDDDGNAETPDKTEVIWNQYVEVTEADSFSQALINNAAQVGVEIPHQFTATVKDGSVDIVKNYSNVKVESLVKGGDNRTDKVANGDVVYVSYVMSFKAEKFFDGEKYVLPAEFDGMDWKVVGENVQITVSYEQVTAVEAAAGVLADAKTFENQLVGKAAGSTTSSIKEVGEKMGKTLILADDKPGFIVNRALLPMLNEACVIVGSHIGSVEDVDNGMKLGCNHPMGPLELADMIGLDILLNVMTVLHSEYGEKYHPSLLLRKMVRAGFLGRKSGAGFYVYENGKKAGVNPNLTRVHAL